MDLDSTRLDAPTAEATSAEGKGQGIVAEAQDSPDAFETDVVTREARAAKEVSADILASLYPEESEWD